LTGSTAGATLNGLTATPNNVPAGSALTNPLPGWPVGRCPRLAVYLQRTPPLPPAHSLLQSLAFVHRSAGGAHPRSHKYLHHTIPSGRINGTYDQRFNLDSASSFNPAFITANGGSPASATVALVAGLNAGR
jgi:hypothetical protein